ALPRLAPLPLVALARLGAHRVGALHGGAGEDLLLDPGLLALLDVRLPGHVAREVMRDDHDASGPRSGVTTPPRSGHERVASRRPLRRQVAAALDVGLDAQARRLERVAALAVGEPLELVRRQRGVARRRVVRPDRRDLAVGTELVPLRPADVLVTAGLEVRPLDAELLAVADDPVDRPARPHALHEADPQVGDRVAPAVRPAYAGREVVHAVLGQDLGEPLAAGGVAGVEVRSHRGDHLASPTLVDRSDVQGAPSLRTR